MEKILEQIREKGETFVQIRVVPKSPKTEIIEEMADGTLKMRVKAVPEKGKANEEIVRFFRKNYKLNCTIISGQTARTKLIKLWI
jgi:uncharacterized protein (TIGR00251 family)